MRKVKILGTKYTIKILDEKQDEKLKYCDGYCDKTSKEIVVLKINEENSELHNFLFESGLHESTKWEVDKGGHNEQIVDWLAVQFPKIQQAFEEVGCL